MERSVGASYPAVYFFKMVEKLWKSDLANKKVINPEKGEIRAGVSRDQGMMDKRVRTLLE